jgi:amino acid transporter
MFGNFSNIDFFETPISCTSLNYNDFLVSIGLIFGSSALIFFAYYGFENIPNIAEETRNPSKTISRAIIIIHNNYNYSVRISSNIIFRFSNMARFSYIKCSLSVSD